MTINQRKYRAKKLGYDNSNASLIPIFEFSTNCRDMFVDEFIISSVSLNGERVAGRIRNGATDAYEPSPFILPISILTQDIQTKCIERLENKLNTANDMNLRELDDVDDIFKMKVGEKCTYQGYMLRGFYFEDDVCLEPDILGGVEVYKDGEYLFSITNEEQLEHFRDMTE